MFGRGYYRVSDDSVSSFQGLPNRAAALKDCQDTMSNTSGDITRVWMRNERGDVVAEWVLRAGVWQRVSKAATLSA